MTMALAADIALGLDPPYYAVIFASKRPRTTDDGYKEAADRMAELVQQQPGYLGMRSVRDENGHGITVSYWRDEDSIRHWRENLEHAAVRAEGRQRWYEGFEVQVARVERCYSLAPQP